MLAIDATNLHKKFGSKSALSGVSLQVREGEIFGFIGPNGAGKSTTMRCLMDFIRPSHGTVKLFGKDARADGVALRSVVSFLSADTSLYPNWSGEEHIKFVCQTRGIANKRASELCEQLGLDPRPKVHQLSSGNKQKLGLVIAMMSSPKLLILDEPTRALDPLVQATFQELMRDFRDQGGTVLMSSHNLTEVEQICTDIAVVREGRTITNATMASLRAKSAHTITATFAHAFDAASLTKLGAHDLQTSGAVASFKVVGDIGPMLKFLASAGVTDLDISRASLEELFMEMYQ